MYLKKFLVIFCVLVISNISSQNINLSDNSTISHQPNIIKQNDLSFVFWVDGQNDSQNIYYRYKDIDQWSAIDTLFCSGQIQLKSIISSGNDIYLLWIQNEVDESKLMVGLLNNSFEFESNEIVTYNDYQITSSSLFIDNNQQLNITWDTYLFSDYVRIFYSFANDIYTWQDSEILFEELSSELFDYNISSQLATDAQDNLYCFWLSNDNLNAISYRIKPYLGNWNTILQIYNFDYGFGANFSVKNDVYRNIHIVSNIPYLTTLHNDLIYTYWNGTEWLYPELIPYWTNYSPLNERWNPDIAFLDDNSVYVTWGHYAFSVNFVPRGSWIGSSVRSSEGWHENGPIAFNREPHCPKILIENDQIQNVWHDDSDGDSDIYFTITEPYTSSIDENVLNSNDNLNCKNYPNPFNPSTTIEFTIKTNSKIELSIYNIKGQNIKTLTRNEFVEGQHSLIWNGNDESGNPVSSGIYYYKLSVNGKSEAVKKCLLLK